MFCNWKDKNLSLKNRLIAHEPVSLGHSQRSTIWVSIWPNYESNCYFSWAVAPFLPSMTWNIRHTNNRDLREDCSISVLSFLDIPSIFSSNSAYLCNPFDSSCVSLQLLEKKSTYALRTVWYLKLPSNHSTLYLIISSNHQEQKRLRALQSSVYWQGFSPMTVHARNNPSWTGSESSHLLVLLVFFFFFLNQ